MSKINLPNSRATSKGYTIPTRAECEGEILNVLIRDDADTTSSVTAWDVDAQVFVTLNGLFWTFNCVESIDRW